LSIVLLSYYPTSSILFYSLSLHDALPICTHLYHCRNWFRTCIGRLHTSFKQLEYFYRQYSGGCARLVYDLSNDGTNRLLQPSLRSEEHTSELQSRENLVCRLLLEKKNSI